MQKSSGDYEKGGGGYNLDKPSTFAKASAFFKRKRKQSKDVQVGQTEDKGWVKAEDGGKGKEKSKETESVGLIAVLTNPNRYESIKKIHDFV